MSTPRRFLRFQEAVLKRFDFLESLGLRPEEVNETYVRYAGKTVDIEVFHGRQSYEVGVNVVREGDEYSLDEFLEIQASDRGVPNTFQTFAATDAHGVEIGVTRLASAVRTCAELILTNSPELIGELQERRKRNRSKLALDSLVGQIRPVADEAFRARNYRRAAELYERIRERLSPAEIRRLEIAKSRS